MLVNQNIVNVQGNLDAFKTQKFGIECNSVAFDVWMNGLYSDKIGSIIRELLCNARDSHKEAGTLDKSIDVHIPDNLIEPYFSIRDYGTGLSEQSVFDIYTVFFKSTKRDSNDMIGGFGLGSKTPFSYVDSFNVTSWFEGTKTEYLIYKDASGFPTITKVVQVESEEHNGIEVKFGVKSEDCRVFMDKVVSFLVTSENFNCNVLNKMYDFSLPEKEEVLATLGQIKVTKGLTHNRSLIRVGDVGYPLGFRFVDELGIETFLDQNKNFPAFLKDNEERNRLFGIFAYNVFNLMVFNFPVGFIDVTASRESIALTEKTKYNIIKTLCDMYDDLSKKDLTIHSTADYEKRAELFERCRLLGLPVKVDDIFYKDYLKYENYNLTLNIPNIIVYVGAYEHKELKSSSIDDTFRVKTTRNFPCQVGQYASVAFIVKDIKRAITNVYSKGNRFNYLVYTKDADRTYDLLKKKFGCAFVNVYKLSELEFKEPSKDCKEEEDLLNETFRFVNTSAFACWTLLPKDKNRPIFYIPYSTKKEDYENLCNFFDSFNFWEMKEDWVPEKRGFYKILDKTVEQLKGLGFNMVNCFDFYLKDKMPKSLKRFVVKAVVGQIFGTRKFNFGSYVAWEFRNQFCEMEEVKKLYEYILYRKLYRHNGGQEITYDTLLECLASDNMFRSLFHIDPCGIDKKSFIKKCFGEILKQSVKLDSTMVKQLLKGNTNAKLHY